MSAEPAPTRTPAKARAKRHPHHEWSPDARALNLVGDKRTLLIVRDLFSGPRRFVALQHHEIPPRVDYELTPAGKAPTLVWSQPLPLRRFIGDLPQTDAVLLKLEIAPHASD